MSKVYRSGVRFDCEQCGLLLRDDDAHADEISGACLTCGGTLRLVGVGNNLVQNARWLRCRACSQLHMQRRGEIVMTTPRNGFDEFS